MTKKQPQQGASSTSAASSPKTLMIFYSVLIKRFGDERFTIEHAGSVNLNDPQSVADLLAGILSVSRVGPMNAHRLTEITVTVKRRERGVVTPATE